MLLKDAFGWLGSAKEFEDIFGRQVCIDATQLFCAPTADLVCAWKKPANISDKVPSHGDIDPMRLLTPAQRRRANQHIQSSKFGPNIFADLMHETSHCTAGPFTPPLLRNSILYSSRLNRPAVAAEHLVIQGILAYEFLCCRPDDDRGWLDLLRIRD